MRVLAFGEILWDIIDGSDHLGGAPLNFAAHSVKSGATSFIISKLGADDFGLEAKAKTSDLGVRTDYIAMDAVHPTGTVEVFLKSGQPDYLINEQVAYDFIETDIDELPLTEFDVFYFGTLAQRTETTRKTLYQILENGNINYRFYDVNLRKNCFSVDNIKRSFQYANIIKLNDEEVPEVSKMLFDGYTSMLDFAKACNDQYKPEVILITAGADGCYIFWKGELQHVKGEQIVVKDAIGAGDAFSAAFMYKYFQTGDAMLAASVANKVGSYVASQEGAIPDYPNDLKQLLATA